MTKQPAKEKSLNVRQPLPETISFTKLIMLDNPIDVARYTCISDVLYPVWHHHRKPTQGELDHLHLFAIGQCLKRGITITE